MGYLTTFQAKRTFAIFLSERSLSKTGSEVIATLQLKKTQRCIHRILKILGFCEALMLRNAEVLQGIDVEKC